MSSVDPTRAKISKINVVAALSTTTTAKEWVESLPKLPGLTISLPDSQTFDDHKKDIERLSKEIIDVHHELNALLKAQLQGGTILIKIYMFQSSKLPPYLYDGAYFWENKKRILYIKTKYEFIDIIEAFVYGICMIQSEDKLNGYTYKNADEYARVYEQCRYSEVMLKNKLIKKGVEKYQWPENLKNRIIVEYSRFELYFEEAVKAYLTKNALSSYDQDCKFYVKQLQQIYQEEFKREVEKKLYLDFTLTGDALLKQSELVMKSLQNQIRLIELIYKMYLEEKIIEGLCNERSELYHLRLELKSKKKELGEAEKHMQAMQNLLKNDKSDLDLQADTSFAKERFSSAQMAYNQQVEKIEKQEKIIKDKEASIMAVNKPILDDNDDKLRAEMELRAIEQHIVVYNKAIKDKPVTKNQTLGSGQNGLVIPSVAPKKPMSGILINLQNGYNQETQANSETAKEQHDSVNKKTPGSKFSK